MKTKCEIRLETKFNKFMQSDFDDRFQKGGSLEGINEDEETEGIEESFHECFKQYLENQLFEFDDRFEGEMLNLIHDEGWDLNVKSIDSLNKFGTIKIHTISADVTGLPSMDYLPELIGIIKYGLEKNIEKLKSYCQALISHLDNTNNTDQAFVLKRILSGEYKRKINVQTRERKIKGRKN